jgi:lantibiotic biosynthesis protein
MQSTQTDTLTNQFMQAALDAGYRLVREAIWQGDCCNWIGGNIAPTGGRYQVVKMACPANIYSGIGGIALFLSQLTQQVADPLLQETFEAAMRTLVSEKMSPEKMPYGYYCGQLGIADILIQIGTAKQQQAWVTQGWQMMQNICENAPSENELDIITGVAGSIPVLLKYYRAKKEDWLLIAAENCGNLLLSKAVKTETHYTWVTMAGSPGLTGYSHGNAGIALALLELYQVTQNNQWLNAAMMGFQYERQLFDNNNQNWPDLRQVPGAPPTTTYSCQEAWCHGAPGIALSRLRAWQITNDVNFLNEARTALHTTYLGLHRSQTNYSLCHGIAGNADVLLTAGLLLQDNTLVFAAREAGRIGIENHIAKNLDWSTGVSDPNGAPGTSQNPSLLLGLAGTGYFYLRLYNPFQVPTVLMPG